MVKRAYSPREILRMTYKPIPWDGEWKRAFGNPDINDTWFICGSSAAGKSSFVMQLAKKLTEYGTVLYLSREEGTSLSFNQRLRRFHMEEVQKKFRVIVDSDIDSLRERLHKRKSPKFIIVDSFQMVGWGYSEAEQLVEEFPHKSFIFISQAAKGAPLGKPAYRLEHLAGVKIWVKGFKAECKGRFIPEVGVKFPIWQDGIIQTTNNI